MKGFLFILLLLVLNLSLNAKTINKAKIDQRKQLAVEILSEDEGFLSDYINELSEKELYYFYSLAFKMVEDVAEETKNIEDDYTAYEYIKKRIYEKNGIKENIINKINAYLKGEYELNEIELKPMYRMYINRMHHNNLMVLIQKKMSSL